DSGGSGTPYALGRSSMRTRTSLLMIGLTIFLACSAQAQFFFAHDPGIRRGPAGAGDNLATLTAGQKAFFEAGRDAFLEAEGIGDGRSEEHTSELQSRFDLVCRLLLEKKKDAHRLSRAC